MRKNKIIILAIKIVVIIAITTHLLLINSHDSVSSSRGEIPPAYSNLINQLEKEGFHRDFLINLYSDPRVEFYEQSIYKNIIDNVSSYVSDIYREKVQIYDIDDFIREYDDYLKAAEERFNVEKETIVAILFTETKLGKIIGKYPVFNVLSSLAVASEPKNLQKIEHYVNIKYHYYDYDTRQQVIRKLKERAIERSNWAKSELVSLLKLHLTTKIDALSLVGSYAGAFGLPQFMPSSMIKYGVDGDNDGDIDLYSYPDAIMSVANFLSNSGWSKHHVNKRRALLRYNYSSRYVRRVLNLASLLNKRY